MSSLLPNSNATDLSLLSAKGISETKDECVRLLDEMQIVVDPSSLQGSDGLECELVENPCESPRHFNERVSRLVSFGLVPPSSMLTTAHFNNRASTDAAGAMDTPRYVRFCINFRPISPSVSPSSSSAHARAGFVSLLTLVKQKGSSTSLKLVYNRLRRDWVLDDLSLTVSKLKGSALHRYDDGNNAADEPERHALTEIKLIPKRSPVIDAFAISPAMPPAISRTPARPRASH
ncbi:hypothetical protein DL93DRAFT_2079033 [Clavulina sp. PMI_390]|nr:hypothetical protein DL93DRAFT_2079033 [Clavulina sp. PMI_390]